MALILKLISPSQLIDGQATEHEFNALGGTIGRKPGNDLVLLDPERYISGRHALIEYRDGHYYITDTSTNGVYVNDARVPLGQGNTTEIMSGDKITIGTYQLLSYISDNVSNKSPVSPTGAVNTGGTTRPPATENPIDSLLNNAADLDNPHAIDHSMVDPLALLGVGADQHPPTDRPSSEIPENIDLGLPDDADQFGETEPLPEFSNANENIDDIFNLINSDNKKTPPVERQQPVTIDEQFTPPSNFIPEDWDLMEGKGQGQAKAPAAPDKSTPAKTSHTELDPLQIQSLRENLISLHHRILRYRARSPMSPRTRNNHQ